MAQIIMSGNIVIPDGPKFAFNRTLDVEAYDKIDVTVPATPATNNKEVGLQPGGAGKVKFIAIISDSYDDNLTYKINAANAGSRTLDQPQLLAGKGAVSLFDSANPPTKLFFSNTAAGKDANVQILIGRQAT
jgi:hypothetical protein